VQAPAFNIHYQEEYTMSHTQPTVIITIDGGIADVVASKNVRVVMVDFDVLKSGDMPDGEFIDISNKIDDLRKLKSLDIDLREEIQEIALALQEYAESKSDHN